MDTGGAGGAAWNGANGGDGSDGEDGGAATGGAHGGRSGSAASGSGGQSKGGTPGTANTGGAVSGAYTGGAGQGNSGGTIAVVSGGANSGGKTAGPTGGTPGSEAASGGASNGGSATTGGVTSGGSATSGGASNGGSATTGGVTSGGSPTTGATTYTPKSAYLINPDHARDVIESLADFRAKSRDDANGGFFSFVNLDGTVSSDRRKGFVTTSRDAWTFARTFTITGDENYLELASHALDYLYAHGWDDTNGGWFFTSDEFGRLTPYSQYWDPNTWKWSFVQHYALLGIGAYCEATRDPATCNWLKKGENYLNAKMWDSNGAELGYFERADLNSSNGRNKGFTATVDALTTNAVQAALLWPATYHQRMVDLADIVVNRLANAMDGSSVKFGFPEYYGSSWNVDSGQTGGDVGHVLKAAWVLARVYMRNPDARYRAAARKFIHEVLNHGGWDSQQGVPYTHYDWRSGQVTHQAESWQIEQAVTSGLSNWHIAEDSSDKDAFLEMADRALLFYDAHVIDHERGGTYKLNDMSGNPIDGKSNFFNVEYHSTELFYFTYLYGNLLLKREPVSLYYMIPASSSEQVIQLNPVAVDDASLQIQSVTLEGAPLSTFSARTREVRLAAGKGGKLRVVFSPGR